MAYDFIMLTLICLVASSLPAAEPAGKPLTLTVSAGKCDRPPGPAVVAVELPEELAAGFAVVRDAQGHIVSAQLTGPGLFDSKSAVTGRRRRELHVLLPALKAGEQFEVKLDIVREPPAGRAGFVWKETPGRDQELRYANGPVLRYECAPLDDSTKAKREATFKVYHHLYADDGTLVTKGLGGLYPHHRGLFYGFRKTTYGNGTEVDIWHCTGDTAQVHETTIAAEAGPVLGRHRVVIDWLGKGKELFAREERELTVWNTPGGRLVEFASVLRPVIGPVKVDGDPQHSGFHFRASNEVADKTKGQTIYIRPDGTDKPGATRNWPDRKDHVNLSWDAMSFVLGGTRYTAAYLDRPDNPKEARYSERDYGRFGSYFVSEATDEKPLKVRYRVWLQRGQMEGKDVAALSAAFVDPVRAVVKE
jgi:Methane oxygenase PmoA